MGVLPAIWRRAAARRSAPFAGALAAAFAVAPIGTIIDPPVYAAAVALGALSVALM